MVIVDTSVWINHFRRADNGLIALLETGLVLAHPFVIGELACGTLHRRAEIIDGLRDLPAPTVAEDNEVLAMIEREALWGRGIGWVDVHLVAAARLGADQVWTSDKQLRSRPCLPAARDLIDELARQRAVHAWPFRPVSLKSHDYSGIGA